MYTPAPIDKDFVPYSKRPVLRRNAGLFVDGAAKRDSGASRVVPQNPQCAGKPNFTSCGSYPGILLLWGLCQPRFPLPGRMGLVNAGTLDGVMFIQLS